MRRQRRREIKAAITSRPSPAAIYPPGQAILHLVFKHHLATYFNLMLRAQGMRRARTLVELRANTTKHHSPPAGFRRLSDAASPRSPHVVSRRVYEAHQRRHPTKETPASSSAKKEEKPWPRSFQIAGYTMAALGIPYSIAWFASSNTQTRETLSLLIPNLDDMLRHHFGDEEPNSVSYCDRSTDTPHFQLPEEPTFQQRLQQERVKELDAQEVKVRVQMRSNGSDDEVQQVLEATVSGRVHATPKDILQSVGYKNYDAPNSRVSVDFASLPAPDGEEESDLNSEDEMVSLPDENPSSNLLRETSTFSTWHYVSAPPQQQTTASSASSQSSTQMEVSQLKYEIEQLQSDLLDINCTRNRDDMQQELKEKKGALRSLQWKRRLRWS